MGAGTSAVARASGLVVALGVLLLLPVAAVVRLRFLRIRVTGNSMSPTLDNGQILWLSRGWATIAPGDVVAFRSPHGEFDVDVLIKRCTAVEGQRIPGMRGLVPGGTIWVEGDGAWSGSSATFGPIPLADIIGRRRNLPAHSIVGVSSPGEGN